MEEIDEGIVPLSSTTTKKKPFKLKRSENGRILSVHHTKEQNGKMLRIRLGCFCFGFNLLIVVDKLGDVFVFDFKNTQYWSLSFKLKKVSVICAYVERAQFLIGTKLGELLLIDAEQNKLLKTLHVSNNAIKEISLPGQPLQPTQMALVNVGYKPVIVNVQTFTATHRLDFNEQHILLKFACYLPKSEQIFTCFTDDSVHIWSGVTLNNLNVVHPIKSRDRKLRKANQDDIPMFSLSDPSATNEFVFQCPDRDYTNGYIQSYCCKSDGSEVILSTMDRYLLVLNAYTFQLDCVFRLNDFDIQQCLHVGKKAKEKLILALTTTGQIVLLDGQHVEFRMIIELTNAAYMSISNDHNFLAVLETNGELHIWSVCHLINLLKNQEQCIQNLKAAFKHKQQPLTFGNKNCVTENILKQLNRCRLLQILGEYGCYPTRYRNLIWCALLKLPYNWQQFQVLYSMNTMPYILQRQGKVRIKGKAPSQILVKVWSCLSHWCNVFAHSEFLPQLIQPFVKMFQKNALVAFEVCVTLIQNHFQLWFEFHPMEPNNYIGICNNILQHFDPQLSKFYISLSVVPKTFVWSLLSNAFSDVLSEEHWFQLWDHIISSPSYFLIFCVVAFNIVQRDCILRLHDTKSITHFFSEPYPIDIDKFIKKAYMLMKKCPNALHPMKYINGVQRSIPKNVYPKFVNYPIKLLTQHEEDIQALRKKHQLLDSRLRQLELVEHRMVQKLENELKDEEHKKRINEMEKMYQDTIKREEERIACQRKLLLIYQKEIRNRKMEMLSCLMKCDRRKRSLQTKTDMDKLLHGIERDRLQNDTNLLFAEDELCNHDIDLMGCDYFVNANRPSLSQKYRDDLQRLQKERAMLSTALEEEPSHILTNSKESTLGTIEKQINDIQKEILRIIK